MTSKSARSHICDFAHLFTCLGVIFGAAVANLASVSVASAGPSLQLYLTPGRPHPEYLAKIKAAPFSESRLIFSEGQAFDVQGPEHLGQGSYTTTLALKNGHALRVPGAWTRGKSLPESQEQMFNYILGQDLLRKKGIRIPLFYQIGGMNFDTGTAEFVEVERIHVITTLEAWLDLQVKPPSEQDPLWQALLKFARSTHPFKAIGDFGPDQVVWNGIEWVLVDWDDGHTLAEDRSTETIFTQWPWMKSFREPRKKLLARQLEHEALVARAEKIMAAKPPAMQGPVFHFADGAEFQTLGHNPLGSGNTSVIWEIRGHRALRLPKPDAQSSVVSTNQVFLHQYAQTQALLLQAGAPVPKILKQGPEIKIGSETGLSYLVVEKISARGFNTDPKRLMTLEAWLLNVQQGANVDPVLELALEDFAARLAPFRSIGDFGPHQIVWTGSKWMLLDWFSAGTQKSQAADDPTPFSHLLSSKSARHPRVQALYARAEAAVRNARPGGGAFCEQLLTSKVSQIQGFELNVRSGSGSESFGRKPRQKE